MLKDGRVNQCIRHYPDFDKTVTFSYPVYNPDKLPTESKRKDYSKDKNETRPDSLKRAVDKIFDIAYLNDFEYFVTLTLNGAFVNRYDVLEVGKKLKNWLRNQKQRKDAKYIIVPELHKDGAIHFHGLMSGRFHVTDSGKHTCKGQVIYNLEDWTLGYTTAVRIYGEKVAISRYICKYVTKDTKKIFGNVYFAGGDIVREPCKSYAHVDYYKAKGIEREIKGTGMKVKYCTEVYEHE